MKESLDNKSLVKINNNNIFYKIKNWILKLFGYGKPNIENDIRLNSINKEIEEKSDFKETIKISKGSDTTIFDLQRRYENGDLKVIDLSKEEYSKLENLYNNQIENLQNQIKYKKSMLSTN